MSIYKYANLYFRNAVIRKIVFFEAIVGMDFNRSIITYCFFVRYVPTYLGKTKIINYWRNSQISRWEIKRNFSQIFAKKLYHTL